MWGDEWGKWGRSRHGLSYYSSCPGSCGERTWGLSLLELMKETEAASQCGQDEQIQQMQAAQFRPLLRAWCTHSMAYCSVGEKLRGIVLTCSQYSVARELLSITCLLDCFQFSKGVSNSWKWSSGMQVPFENPICRPTIVAMFHVKMCAKIQETIQKIVIQRIHMQYKCQINGIILSLPIV